MKPGFFLCLCTYTYQKFAATDHRVLVCQYFLHPVPPISTDVYVQLEKLSFTVEEEVGYVEICANVSTDGDSKCPIEFDVGIIMSTRAGTAGAVKTLYICANDNMWSHLACTAVNQDFALLSEEVYIPECGKRVCVNVTIFDDAKVEYEEMFNVTLERIAALEGNIKVRTERTVAMITIIDKDGTYYIL